MNLGGSGGLGPAPGRSSHLAPRVYGEMSDLPGRLSRSATTALLLSPIGILLISVTRLLIISDFNPVSASAIASSGGYVDTLLGTVIPLVSLILPYIALALLFFNRVILGALTILAVVLAVPMAMTRSAAIGLARNDWHAIVFRHSTITFVVLIPLAVVFAAASIIELLGFGVSVFLKTTACVVCIILLPFTCRLYPFPTEGESYIQIVRQPWLPPETITLNNRKVIVGYILSYDGDWATVLTESDRKVTYYSASRITGRAICRIGRESSMPPLLPIFSSTDSASNTSPCPRLSK